MAETAVAAVLTKFGQLAVSEGKLLVQVGDDMMLLRDRLEWLQAFIRDADRKRRTGTDGLTRVWVRQTRDVAFQVEDALDEFFHQVDLESQGYHGWNKWGKYLTGCWTQIVVRHGLSGRLTRIKSRLEHISENQKEYKIEHTPLAMLTSSTTAMAAWRDDPENAVGFDEDVKSLDGMLFRQDHPEPMFISIVGEGGAGKRTLLYMLLKKTDTHEEKFDCIFQINMVADWSADDLLQSIYRGISYRTTQDRGQQDADIDVTGKILHLLAKKTYLMILCGISSITMLNCVRASLPNDNTTSSVVLLLDTESEEVAWHANTMNNNNINKIRLVRRLGEEISGKLFRSRAFRRELSEDKENISNYEKIVYGITGGHPLSIVVLAGLLRFKEKPLQWEAVLQQLMQGPGMEEAKDGDGSQITSVERQMNLARAVNMSTLTVIERIFWASFEDLRNDLKSCFLYFVSIPKNATISAKTFVRMWIDEGFIKPQKGKTMEELGHGCLKELALRCLVEIKRKNSARGIQYVGVHRTLHGFLQSEAREAGLIEVHDIHDVFVPPSARRLIYHILGGRYTAFTNKFPKLRSFICIGDVEDNQISDSTGVNKDWYDLKFLLGSKFLRLIYVYGPRIKKLPKEIGNMIHLRQLAVNSNDLKELPSSITRLLNLQTLDIRKTQVEKIDPAFWKIKTLRHVLAEKLTLPENLQEELGDLQTLHGIKPAPEQKWNQQNCPLHKMTKLRSLKLHGIERAKHGDALKSALVKMNLLGCLKLKGDVLPLCVFTAQSLRYLHKITLDGHVEWPEAPEATLNVLTVRPNLVQVKLWNSNEIPQRIMEEIWNILY